MLNPRRKPKNRRARGRFRRIFVEQLEDRSLLAMVSGNVFDDRNGNGSHDASEPGLEGRTITLDSGVDGTIDATTSTDSRGNYSFSDLAPGSYAIGEVATAGWRQTFPVNPLGGENFPIGDFKPAYSP